MSRSAEDEAAGKGWGKVQELPRYRVSATGGRLALSWELFCCKTLLRLQFQDEAEPVDDRIAPHGIGDDPDITGRDGHTGLFTEPGLAEVYPAGD